MYIIVPWHKKTKCNITCDDKMQSRIMHDTIGKK